MDKVMVNLSKEQIEALEICASLIEISEFKLVGSSLQRVALAQTQLRQLIQEAQMAISIPDTPAPQK